MDLLNLQDAARELDVEDRITQFFNSSGVIISGKNVEQHLDAKLKVCHLSCYLWLMFSLFFATGLVRDHFYKDRKIDMH